MNTKKKRYEFWQQHVSAHHQSGLSQKDYCNQEDIGYCSFNQWKRRIESQQQALTLTEVSRKPFVQTPISDNKIIVSCNNSLQISFPANVSPETLICVLKSLGENTCN